MLAHIEGPIVDSFYDAALLSWGKPLEPSLPLLSSPSPNAPVPWSVKDERKDSQLDSQGLPEHTTKDPHYDECLELEARRVNSSIAPRGNETRSQAVARHLSRCRKLLLSSQLLTSP